MKINLKQVYNPTFNLPDYSNAKLITGNNISVVGNGGTIGLTIGSTNYTLASYGSGSPNGSLYLYTAGNGNPKLITDATKSGIIADTSNFQNMLYCIRY